ncbi:MAG TPA: hypothetical protein VLA34_10930 [Candidatus Krumholzibacterium sp.]|nr:hypothetical protein [Candidatus Krumholzibacterium sp.]
MAKGESYIERLQRERLELVDYVRKFLAWKAAQEFVGVTGKKGSAQQEANRLYGVMEDAYKTIEPYLAD